MLKKLLIVLFLFFSVVLNAQNNCDKYNIVISFDGLSYSFVDSDTLRNFKYLKDNGVSAYSFKPVFPTTTLPNLVSIVTGVYPVTHGIISNSFKNPYTTEQFSISSEDDVTNDKWYNSEFIWETANRHDIKTVSCLWAGANLNNENRHPSHSLDFDEDMSYIERIDYGLDYLKKGCKERPNLLLYYFEEMDITVHKYGTHSVEFQYSLSIIDSVVGYLLQELNEFEILDKTNIIVLSNHGIQDIDTNKYVNIDSILGKKNYSIQNYGAYAMIDADEKHLDLVYTNLDKNQKNYKVYTKEEIPDSYHIGKHPFVSDLLIVAEPGAVLVDEYSRERSREIKGMHGYSNDELSMHGVFFAMGPDFKKNYKASTINSVDVFPLLAKLLSITYTHQIDGKLVKIEHILKDTNE